MPFSQVTADAAEDLQNNAAIDPADAIIVVAGPGTGKTKVIERRIGHLIESGEDPDSIHAVSFTRAASRDLQSRIRRYGADNGLPEVDSVGVSTLHSLALTALKSAGRIHFPVDPRILNDSETKQIYDEEFKKVSGIGKISRIRAIRLAREAFWATAQNNPANYQSPDPPITDDELGKFSSYHGARSQLYACLLPGEMVKLAIDSVDAGTLDLSTTLGLDHLIVDEYQDLNPIDVQFIKYLNQSGTSVFVAGDDDQSLYSFRYAFPQGIIDFGSEYANSSSHVLKHCFRCAESILAAASGLISHHSPPDRIPKDLVSAFSDSSPQVQGLVHRWKCSSAQKESSLIAESCAELHQGGFSYNSIKILVTQKLIGKQIRDALAEVNVPGSVLDDDPFILSKHGEFISAAARLAVNPDDYFGYRVMLHHLPRVGIGTATSISTKAISANLNYRAVFTESLPDDVFNRAENRAIQRVVDLISRLSDWGPDSTVSEIAETGKSLLKDTFSDDVAELWGQYAESLEDEVSLSDLISALNSPNSSEVQQSLAALTSTQSEDQDPKQSVQIMTIHSAKGLDADIVFVPALEEEIIPGSSRAANPGHVLESARMLYVAITRANVACVMSFTFRRLINGASVSTNGSRFVEALGGTFAWRNGPLSPEECASIKSQSEDWHSARN